MCGIAGYLKVGPKEPDGQRLRRMLRVSRHRGPDDEGLVFIDKPSGVRLDTITEDSAKGLDGERLVFDGVEIPPHAIGLGHRRFSIIDVTPGGHQPFWSHDRRVAVVFNGEIYNYLELREELERRRHSFTTASDTEVLVEAYKEWGVDCFRRFNGFWALALYDAERDQLLLSRDRLGKAPLYLTRRPDGLYFASEIKGLFAALGASSFHVRDQAVVDFVDRFHRDHEHRTFYEEIVSFPCAAHAWIEPDGQFTPVSYWEVPRERRTESQAPVGKACETLRYLLSDAVRLRLRADVPVGIELSGGMDSSSVLAFAARTDACLRVFTVSFPGTSWQEEPFAREAARRYGDQVIYTVIQPGAEDFFERANDYFRLMDEPFHSPNQITQNNVWERMKGMGIRVSIVGAAGDEIFAGYGGDYFVPYLAHLWRTGRLWRFFKESCLYTEFWPDSFDLGIYASQLRRIVERMMRFRISYQPKAVSGELDPLIRPSRIRHADGPSRDIARMLIDHMTHWRMNYWLRSGNQNCMGVPMEVRCPMLDYRVVQHGFTLPLSYLIRDGWTKRILRQTVRDILPPAVVWRRKKMGYPFPLEEWLLNGKERLLSMAVHSECPYLDAGKLRQGYEAGVQTNPERLWRLLSVCFWWKRCVLEKPLE